MIYILIQFYESLIWKLTGIHSDSQLIQIMQ